MEVELTAIAYEGLKEEEFNKKRKIGEIRKIGR